MAESELNGWSAGWRRARIVVVSLVTLLLCAMAAGWTLAKLQYGHALTKNDLVEVTVVSLALLGCGLLLVRDVKQLRKDPLRRQERVNRNLLIMAGMLGAVLAVTMILAGGSPGDGALSNEPLPPVAAILLILVLGVLVPALSFYWHRIIDEQEADASKTGALFAFNAYAIGAPVWWLAWRGGFVPPPDGFIIYFATTAVMTLVWLWKKYR